MSPHMSNTSRYTVGILLLIVAVNALAGGYYGMAGAKNVPLEWLQGSPFTNYFIPALFLFVVLGGTTLAASIAVFKKINQARSAALFAAILMMLWIIIQVSIIGYVSWMQPAIAVTALVIGLVAWRFPHTSKSAGNEE